MIMAITAAEVNKLRQQTGAGMMDCKKALEESNGDFEKAVDYLRKKGAKVAANRSDREAKEGVVLAKSSADGKYGFVMVLGCETDFVAKNADFVAFANTIADIALDKKAADVEALKAQPYNSEIKIADKLMEEIGKIGEKIDILYYNTVSGEKVFPYNYPGNRLASVVAFNKSAADDVMKNVAMQVAAMGPVSVDKDDVDAKTLERELEVARDQVRQEGKPEDMVEKIAQGKLNKFYKDSTLLNQDYISDSKKTVRQYLQESDKDLKVLGFKRFSFL
jgi:elongation factor Ts